MEGREVVPPPAPRPFVVAPVPSQQLPSEAAGAQMRPGFGGGVGGEVGVMVVVVGVSPTAAPHAGRARGGPRTQPPVGGEGSRSRNCLPASSRRHNGGRAGGSGVRGESSNKWFMPFVKRLN